MSTQQKSEAGREAGHDAEIADATAARERDIAAIRKQRQEAVDTRARLLQDEREGEGEGPGGGAAPRADGRRRGLILEF